MTVTDYDQHVKEAGELLDRGNRPAAKRMLGDAINKDPERFEAHQLLGIALRLDGPAHYGEADKSFVTATEKSIGANLARVKRDRGQLMMDWGLHAGDPSKLRLAEQLFIDSATLLSAAAKTAKSAQDKLNLDHEYQATRSFHGLLKCEQGDVRTGRAWLREAVGALHGHSPYELNAMVRLLKVEATPQRLAMAMHAAGLALSSKNPERMLEVPVLVLGGAGLHERVKPLAQRAIPIIRKALKHAQRDSKA